jgi:hypothetical protein
MSGTAPLPAPGKLVTVIAVKEGDSLVTYGKVLVAKAHLVAVAAHVEPDLLLTLADSPVTVLYAVEDLSYVIRGRVRECIKPDRLLIETTAEPRVGERREYIRADVEMGVRVDADGDSSLESCQESAAELSQAPGDFVFRDTSIDLSGSGARFNYDLSVKKGTHVVVSLQLPDDIEPGVVHLCARVIRCRPSKNAPDTPELAVEFVAVPEEHRELVNFVVFQARAQQLGVAGLNLTDH